MDDSCERMSCWSETMRECRDRRWSKVFEAMVGGRVGWGQERVCR